MTLKINTTDTKDLLEVLKKLDEAGLIDRVEQLPVYPTINVPSAWPYVEAPQPSWVLSTGAPYRDRNEYTQVIDHTI